ncbi:iron-sulfur cluster assembly accessory protein [Colletotrichum plurivorum]|uniref:Iron-sulfur assembly protein 1 n=1 Tax=Colletotrichum plurivorum TaxID=2175906 RepID=A0A8H6JQZ6_9PEZI|nr:iron-sulfur cluster assembly accessory protein [Colletotrichum plurivorum]
MNAPRIMSRLAMRRHCTAMRCASLPLQSRAYGSPSFQSYPLYPNNAPPPPRDAAAEGSIAQPDAWPKVNETRPPKMSQLSQLSQHQTASPATPTPTEELSATTSTTPKAAAVTATPTATPAKPTRPRSKLRARKAAMKLTPAAVEQLRALLDQPDPKLIKVGVRNRGCSGLAYHLEFVEKPGSFDEEVVQDGVKVLIDSKALFSIIGSEMDWVEDKLSQRFVFKNPNIKEQCGCGESFMV